MCEFESRKIVQNFLSSLLFFPFLYTSTLNVIRNQLKIPTVNVLHQILHTIPHNARKKNYRLQWHIIFATISISFFILSYIFSLFLFFFSSSSFFRFVFFLFSSLFLYWTFIKKAPHWLQFISYVSIQLIKDQFPYMCTLFVHAHIRTKAFKRKKTWQSHKWSMRKSTIETLNKYQDRAYTPWKS